MIVTVIVTIISSSKFDSSASGTFVVEVVDESDSFVVESKAWVESKVAVDETNSVVDSEE